RGLFSVRSQPSLTHGESCSPVGLDFRDTAVRSASPLGFGFGQFNRQLTTELRFAHQPALLFRALPVRTSTCETNLLLDLPFGARRRKVAILRCCRVVLKGGLHGPRPRPSWKVPGLFVISRHSSFAFKGKSIDIRSVAGALGVRFVIEGSVRRATSRIRINVQLIDAKDGTHAWADRFDR